MNPIIVSPRLYTVMSQYSTSGTLFFDTTFWLTEEEREHQRITNELNELINEGYKLD